MGRAMMGDVKISDRELAPLRPVLEEWLKVITRYGFYHREAMKGEPDYPYWYGERASFGSLAAAAWLAEGVALEEYAARKRGRYAYSGRADLWIVIHGHRFVIEGKQLWMSIGARSRTDPRTAIRRELRAAVRDSRKLPKEWGQRVGMVFVVPELPEGEREQVAGRARQFLGDALGPRDQCAWWFRPLDPPEGEGRLYPGVLLVMESSQ